MQEPHIGYVCLCSQVHISNLTRGFSLPNYYLYQTNRFMGIEGGTVFAVNKVTAIDK
jgi:hypothetical protein